MKQLLEGVMNYYELERRKIEKEIEELKEKHEKQLEELKQFYESRIEYEKNEALKIRTYENQYQNLSDFCRVTKNFFFFKENELKQYLLNKRVLKRDERSGKYIPASDKAVLVDNELFVDYEWLRSQLIFVRTMLYFDEYNYEKAVDTFFKNKDEEVSNIANTVFVECKQRSKEFREHKENKYYIGTMEQKERIK